MTGTSLARIGIACLAAVLAGCFSPTSPAAIEEEQLVAPSMSVDLEKTSTDSSLVFVSITNNDQDQWFIAQENDFRLLDRDGLVFTNDWTTAYWSQEPFPSSIRVNPGETVRGFLVFDTNGTHGPYTLRYDYPAGTLREELPGATTTSLVGDWIMGPFFDACLEEYTVEYYYEADGRQEQSAVVAFNGTLTFRFHNGSADLDVGYPAYPDIPATWSWSKVQRGGPGTATSMPIGITASSEQVHLVYSIDGFTQKDYVFTWSVPTS